MSHAEQIIHLYALLSMGELSSKMCSDQCTAEFERSNVTGIDQEKHVTHIWIEELAGNLYIILIAYCG